MLYTNAFYIICTFTGCFMEITCTLSINMGHQEGSSLNNPTSSTLTITAPGGYAESRTRETEGISESPFISNQTIITDNNDDECKMNFHSNKNNYQKSPTNQVCI